ncbi:Small ribosomal subunit biogenesis GTPase RsgA [Paraconexibacter sp. AEG42_29]|uniref:Small ribosomal subunit biogenesis GTPase RsgA n=1 Tax=Paraconexibacter sp. AEG42_29 TaxID=2997339 RepID=A0AAU7AR54_9ACTN
MIPPSSGPGRRTDLVLELQQLGGEDHDLIAGRVLAQYPDRWLVAVAGHDEPLLAPARGRLRRGDGLTPVTGDWVALDPDGAIAAVLDRRGTVVRRAAGPAGGAQVLAANVDLALVVESLPDPNPRRVERLAALASAGGIPAALLLTKADLDPDAWLRATPLARELGLTDAVAVSAADGDGLGTLRSMLAPGTTAVLLGPSGAGKSTLVNALLGEDRQATGAIRDLDGRGRHTTVTRELVALPGGALLIDTPGIREVGLWDGTGSAFADIEAAAAACRFADCGHAGEPGCAVVATVDVERVAAWHKLAREQAWVDDRKAATRAREQLGRQHAQRQRVDRRLKGHDG